MADKIKISYDDFQKAITELHKIEAMLNDFKTALTGKYSMMSDDWRGLAGIAFDDCGRKVLNSFATNIENLGHLATDIERAGQFYREVDQQITQVISAT